MGRSPCCTKDSGLNRGAWTAEEDLILGEYIKNHGDGGWRSLPQKAGLKRCGKSCRLRWLNYLRPDIKRGNISPDEEELIIRLHRLLGNRWSLIAGRLPSRTDNEIKNYWNTHLSKRVREKEVLPEPRKPLRKSKSAPPGYGRVYKTTPVKSVAVRVTNVRNNYAGGGNSNHETVSSKDAVKTTKIKSWWETLMDEMIADDDSELVKLAMTDNGDGEPECPSMEVNGHYPYSLSNLADSQFPHSQHYAEKEVNTPDSLLHWNELSLSDLLSSPYDSLIDFRLEEF